MGVVMKDDDNIDENGQNYGDFVAIEQAIYGAQDFIRWDEPDNYDETDLAMMVV